MEKALLKVSHTIHRDGSLEKHPNGMKRPEPECLAKIGKDAMIKAANKKYSIKLLSLKLN